ncbi:MAG TPA: aldo/keto reductase [Rhizomicrobium sp.]|jgi:aryl-alcohol dehydrogenase-like predicted oxidoreductase
MLEQRRYGSTGLTVSSVVYGAMTIAADPELKDGVAPSLLRALERGVTLVDTARAYGKSEAIVAATLKEWRGPKPLISTKLMPGSRETFRFYRPLAEAYTPQSIRASVEASLTALGVETLDIVHLHQWHYLWTHEHAWLDTLQALKREGKLRFIAVSAQDHEHDALLEAVSTCMIDGLQVIVNIFESRPAASLLPLAAQRGVGVIARCVLDSGGLSGTLSRDDFAARPFLKHAPFDAYAARLEALRTRFVPAAAADMPSLALRFALSLPGVSAVTVGMPERHFVDATLDAAERGALSSDTVAAITREHVWTKNFYERLL